MSKNLAKRTASRAYAKRPSKAEGDAPVSAYIASLLPWQREIAQSFDALTAKQVPVNVAKQDGRVESADRKERVGNVGRVRERRLGEINPLTVRCAADTAISTTWRYCGTRE